MKTTKKLFSLFLALVLALSLAACAKPAETPTVPTGIPADGTSFGTGNKAFTFEMVDLDGTKYTYAIHTDAETVGEALQNLGLIQGDTSEYGLFVKTVCSVTLDYDKDGAWWALYENDVSSPVGVDQVSVTDGAVYAFRAEKA